MSSDDVYVAPSDPGEVGREEHNKGDRFVVFLSNLFSWLWPILVAAIVIQVFLRNFGRMEIGPGNQAWLDDVQWWIYGFAGTVGIAYAVTTNSHVRVDIFHANYSETKKAWIEVFGLTWLFLPFIILMGDFSFHYAVSSVAAGEGSDSPNGLHGLYFLKIGIVLTFFLIGIATWAAYVRNLDKLLDTTLFNQLIVAFPSTLFFFNLAVYYLFYWFYYLTGGPDQNVRRIANPRENPVFEHMFWISSAVAVVFLIALFLIGRMSKDDR